MTNLTTKIKLYANREINFRKDVKLQDNSDGMGVYIAEWNLDIPKPTMAQLDAFESQANEVERLNLVKSNRAKEYPDFKEYLDGIVKGDQAQIDKYIADCLAVKAKYPKE
jgi:signal transduction protein with GAF and PtsI domain